MSEYFDLNEKEVRSMELSEKLRLWFIDSQKTQELEMIQEAKQLLLKLKELEEIVIKLGKEAGYISDVNEMDFVEWALEAWGKKGGRE